MFLLFDIGWHCCVKITPAHAWPCIRQLKENFERDGGKSVQFQRGLFLISEFVYSDPLSVAQAFAAGGLLGDAFLHLLPHAEEAGGGGHGHEHGHGHGHGHEGHSHGLADLASGLWVLTGILIFFVLEKALPLLGVGHSHSHTGHSSHDHGASKKRDLPDASSAASRASASDKTPTLRQRKAVAGSSDGNGDTDRGRATDETTAGKSGSVFDLSTVKPGAVLNMIVRNTCTPLLFSPFLLRSLVLSFARSLVCLLCASVYERLYSLDCAVHLLCRLMLSTTSRTALLLALRSRRATRRGWTERLARTRTHLELAQRWYTIAGHRRAE